MAKSSAPKRFIVGLNVVIQIVLVAVVVVVINLAIHRWHPPKLDLTSNKYYKLSDKTKELLKSLKAPVNVIVFFQPASEDPLTQRVFHDIQNLLIEYKSASGQLRVSYVDPDRDPIRAEKLAQEYGVKDLNVVVFAQEKRSKFLHVNDLVELERSGNPFGGGRDRVKAFKGEQQFTSAIQNVVEGKQPKVYFLQGHGEGDPEEFDPKRGFSTVAQYIRRDNLLVEKLNIFEKQQIPKDCEALVIAGPIASISELELKIIRDYLSQNGRLMVLLDALRNESGLDKFLAEFGVKVGNDVVLCEFLHLLQGKKVEVIAPGTKYANHPITEKLQKERVQVLLPAARSIDRMSSVDASKQRVTMLVETPVDAWGETDLQRLQNEGKAERDEKDRKGPVSVAVAIEPSTAGEMEREGMRIVVFGSSGFARNASINSGNLDLFMNSLNWLIKRQHLIGIAPKTPREFSLVLSATQQRALFVTEVFAIPLAVAALGFLVWVKRRK